MTTDDIILSGEAQNGVDLKGLLFTVGFGPGDELYLSTLGDLLGEIGCLTDHSFGKADEDPTERLEFVEGDNAQLS